MAKRRGSGGGMGGMGMLRQLQGMQEELLKAQEEVAAMTLTATSGGGAVEVTVTGDRRVQSILIKPEVVDPDDTEMLQDLILTAVNQALEKVEQAAAERMGAVTGGLGLPGLGM